MRPSGSQSMENGSPSTRAMTSRLPSVPNASTSPASQSHIQRRPSCHRGHSPIRMPVADVAPVERGLLAVIGGGVFVVLASTAGQYGYHRDELYFLAAGRHLAWGYPDQPPLVPVMAHIIDTVAPNSLFVLRLPSAIAAAAMVVITGLLARELGGGRGSQALAAGS